jgi:hypothetical protein
MSKQVVFESLGMVMAFLGIGIAYFAIYFGIRQERIKREFEHKERMTALELGRPLPGDLPWLTPLRIGFLIGLVVPVSAFAFAWLATGSAGYHNDIWQSAAMVSIFAVVCGTVVVSLATAKQAGRQPEAMALEMKPAIEEDAFDVVSARG